MEAKNKANAETINGEGGENAQTEFELKIQAKEKDIVELKEKLEEVKGKETASQEKHENMKGVLKEHQENLEKIIESCKVGFARTKG